MTMAWSSSTSSPRSTAIRATTVDGLSKSSRKIFSRQSTTAASDDLQGSLVEVVGLDLVAADQHRAPQPEAAVGGDRRQPGRDGQREILQHELEVGDRGSVPDASVTDASARRTA